MIKNAIIFGVTGQAGSYLSELLLSKDYQVIGINRRTSSNNTERLQNCINNPLFSLVDGDLADPSSINSIISTYKPNECYNLAAQSHVGISFSQPSYAFQINANGPLYILEAIRFYSPQTKFYQASTSEMFGSNFTEDMRGNFVGMTGDCFGNDKTTFTKYQNEQTPLSPNSPYAIAKTAAHHLVRLYRDAYHIHASAGILFNHESERRGENFVTRKITKYIGQLINYKKNVVLANLGFIDEFPKLKLGNIDTVRDWGYAPDYVEAMWLMLQQDKPDDYIVGTGEGHTVREFLEEAFSMCLYNWQDFVEIDPNLYRPNEVPYLRCDASKVKRVLGWKPKTLFTDLVRKMVEHDIQEAKKNS